MTVDAGGARSCRTLAAVTGAWTSSCRDWGLNFICCSFLMRSFSIERFMLWINHFGSSVKGEFGEGNSRSVRLRW